MLTWNALQARLLGASTRYSVSRMRPRRWGARIASLWRYGHREAREDMRRNWLILLIIVFWFGGLITCILLLSLLVSDGGTVEDATGNPCLPDGSFSVTNDNPFSYWSSSGFFQITLGFGSLSFDQAKVIDVIWDVVFGRLGQSLIALISWRVFKCYVTKNMESSAITLDTYRTIFLHNDSLLFAIPRMIRDFALRLRLRSVSAMCFIIMTLLHIVSFPTLGGAMTGYSANVGPYVPDNQGNYIPFDELKVTAYIIHDGARINQTNDFSVPHLMDGGQPYYSWLWMYADETNSHDSGCSRFVKPPLYSDSNSFLIDCLFLSNVSYYVYNYGYNGVNQTSSQFMGKFLDPPALNITPVYFGRELEFETVKIRGNLIPPYLFDPQKKMWPVSNQTVDVNYVQHNGICQAEKSYQWGFSFIQLNVLIFLTLLWSTGILTMHLQSRSTFRKEGVRDVAGSHKAILELAHAIQQQLLRVGSGKMDDVLNHVNLAISLDDLGIKPNPLATISSPSVNIPYGLGVASSRSDLLSMSALSESTINRRISKDLRGGSISYRKHALSLYNNLNNEAKTTTRTWFRREKWWLVALVLAPALAPAAILPGLQSAGPDYVLFEQSKMLLAIGVPVSVIFAFFTGSTTASRIILIFYAYIILGIVPAFCNGMMVIRAESVYQHEDGI